MITLALILVFIGSYALYNTSNKAMLSDGVFETWCKNNATLTKLIAIVLFAIILCISIINFGLTSGILFWLFGMMLVLSLIVVLNPLKLIGFKTLLVLIGWSLIFEFFI